MAIVKMSKFTILTFEAFKSRLLKELQIFEGVHFKDLQESDLEALEFLKRDPGRDAFQKAEAEVSKIKFIQEKIKPFVKKPGGLGAYTEKPREMSFEAFDAFKESYDYNQTYDAVKQLDEKLKTIKVERNKIKADNEALKIWLPLDTSTKELDSFKQTAYFLGVLNKADPDGAKEALEAAFPESFLEIVQSNKDETAILFVVPTEQADEALTVLKNLAFTKTNHSFAKTPKELMADNDRRLAALLEEETTISDETSRYADEDKQLKVALDLAKTNLERIKACDNFLTLNNVVILEGWVATGEVELLNGIAQKCCGSDYYLEHAEVEKDSGEVPIKLHNNKVVAAFEGITSMYALPRYNELDPTPLLTPFYIGFFGIMIGDVGYGLILLIVSLIATKVLNLGKGTRNFMTFLFYLSFSVIFVGFLYGGIFGFTFFTPITAVDDSGQIIQKAIIDSSLDIVNMIVYSVVIGVFHVLLGVAIKGYLLLRDGKILDAVFDSLFWILCLLGGIGMLVSVAVPGLPPALFTVSQWVFYGMLVGLVLTQGRSAKSIGTKLASGLFEVYGITGYVGDIVSYTRLVALALSGAYIAQSFNLMAGLMPGFLKFIFGVLIFVFGQTLNLGLSVLGAYVHTCRLQYVEFFGKFYEGGGKPFKAFKLQNESVIINKK